MSNDSQKPQSGGETGSSSRFHAVQPLRDLESNWAVDLARSLEEYLLKICSGEITGGDDAHFSINFAEAALLLQGSIQVYSRKVEYLYTLVLHALEFISQKRSQEQAEGTQVQPEASSSHTAHYEDNDQFWCLDDIPVEEKNSLDDLTSKDAPLHHFAKTPANLVVLEGDCLDSTEDGGDLESYLIATNYPYRNFILLDPCDAIVVDNLLKGDKAGEVQCGSHWRSSFTSKARKSFLSPTRHSGEMPRKSSNRKKLDNTGQPSCGFEGDNCNAGPDPSDHNIPENGNYGSEIEDHYFGYANEDGYDSDGDDPWKPLNPHEPGNLKVKPFRKVKVSRRQGTSKQISLAMMFPLAKVHGTISPELMEIWEMRLRARERMQESQTIPFYEKLRQSLVHGKSETHDTFPYPEDDEDNELDLGAHDVDQPGPEFDLPGSSYMDEGAAFHTKKHDVSLDYDDANEPNTKEDPKSQGTLEDLCRAHLDSLLASLAESEKQTELAARVSTWKQGIELDLEEQDSRPPFDIQEYGERLLDKLSRKGKSMSFADIIMGQQKHDIARSFTAMLQLVNDRKIDVDGSGEAGKFLCYTSMNSFYVQLVGHDIRPNKMQFQFSKKRPKSPTNRGCNKDKNHQLGGQPCDIGSPPSSGSKLTKLSPLRTSCRFPMKLGKPTNLICTPEGKRRRSSRFLDPVDLNSMG
ncbi:hypothetical protein Nepgr_010131 [Nepenthes gracilis]|uniref:Condensin-2 complex subunit H2 n=1 Tax=Nepenthes gracilis TaxID=150966 RepID=A0AAD3SCE3_NEPGR|nr:hypothetical protein Nepgr_010131 [Nepenthes gracilis]